jgi:MFS family permease
LRRLRLPVRRLDLSDSQPTRGRGRQGSTRPGRPSAPSARLPAASPTWLTNPYLAVAAIALVGFCNDIQLPGAWTACMDVGGKAVDTLSGTMNMMGNIGGFVSSIVCGYIVEQTGNWNLAFYVTAGAYLVGAVCWLGMDPVKPLEEQARRTRCQSTPATH